MNGWYLTGVVIWRGQKRSEKAPWPCLVESDGGPRENPLTRVPVDIFGDIEVGQRVELYGFLDSREWNGKNYLQLVVRGRKVEGASLQSRQQPPRRYSEADQPPSRYGNQPMPDPAAAYNPEEDIPF